MGKFFKLILVLVTAATSFDLHAQDSAAIQKNNAAEIAKKLANPIASLISVPFQSNWDVGIGDSQDQSPNYTGIP